MFVSDTYALSYQGDIFIIHDNLIFRKSNTWLIFRLVRQKITLPALIVFKTWCKENKHKGKIYCFVIRIHQRIHNVNREIHWLRVIYLNRAVLLAALIRKYFHIHIFFIRQWLRYISSNMIVLMNETYAW